MSKTRVYLHIGEPKCGTTFLQDVLWSNRSLLAKHDVTLPGAGIDEHYRAAQDIRELEQADDDPHARWEGAWNAVAKQARDAGGVAVISHELICGADEAQVARAVESLRPADVHVIVTARDFASLLPAEWQETVKHRNERSWHKWLGDIIDTPPADRRPRAQWFWSAHDTPAVLKRWSDALSPDRVHLVTVPPSGSPTDLLWSRFASVIGIPDVAVEIGERSNESLGVVEVELLRRINERLPELPMWFYSRHVKGVLAHKILAARPKGAKLRLPDSRHEWVRDQSAKRLAGISALGIDVVGGLEEIAAPETFSGDIEPYQVTEAELLDAALDALAGTIERRYARATQPAGVRQIVSDAAPDLLRTPALSRLRPAAERLGLAARRRLG